MWWYGPPGRFGWGWRWGWRGRGWGWGRGWGHGWGWRWWAWRWGPYYRPEDVEIEAEEWADPWMEEWLRWHGFRVRRRRPDARGGSDQ